MGGSDHRIVILVLANKAAALRGLLRLLDERFRIVIHLDAKTDAAGIELPAHASFTAVRLPIFWGGFNIMLAVRELLDEAYRVAPDFRRAVLLTGDTLPLLPPDRLQAELLDEVREYIQLTEVPNDPSLRGLGRQEAQARGSLLAWRFQNFSYFDDEMLSPRSRDEFIRKYAVDENTADYLRGEAEKIALKLTSRLRPRIPVFSRFYYGESWWGLTRFSLDLIMDDLHAPVNEEFFRLLQVPDEHFVQTVLGNKRRALGSMNRQIVGSPIFVDHVDPVRSSFGRDALSAAQFRHAALGGRHLFARKYDPELMPDIAAAVASGRFFGDIVGS